MAADRLCARGGAGNALCNSLRRLALPTACRRCRRRRRTALWKACAPTLLSSQAAAGTLLIFLIAWPPQAWDALSWDVTLGNPTLGMVRPRTLLVLLFRPA